MLKRWNGMVCVFSFAGLLALGCDNGSSKPSGTGGTIGGTGGRTGTGGSGVGGMGTGGSGIGGAGTGGSGVGGVGTGGSAVGGAGGALTPAQQNDAIINGVAPSNVIARDPSITGAPPTYTNGICQ